ncbi:MAG: hypothetical protein P8185_24070, partial [Deltaproteobacteria bacterium]
GSMVDIRQILMGLPVRLFEYLSSLIFPPPDQTHIPNKSCIRIIIHNALSDFFVKIAHSLLFSMKRNILKFNRLSTIAAFIFLISIISFNVNYLYVLNNIYNDDCLICNTGDNNIDDVLNLSSYDVYQISSNFPIIVIASTNNVFIHPYDLTFKFPNRGPPARPQSL